MCFKSRNSLCLQLLWIILVASGAALVIQSLAANLGVVTGIGFSLFPFLGLLSISHIVKTWVWFFLYYTPGKHLAEHCKNEYEKVTNFILWILAEISIVACDIPEGITIFYCFYAKSCFQKVVFAPSSRLSIWYSESKRSILLQITLNIPIAAYILRGCNKGMLSFNLFTC